MTRTVALVVFCLACTRGVEAQSPDLSDAHRFTVSAGLSWLGGSPVGASTATLRLNELGTTTPGSFSLFEADTSLERAFGAGVRFGVRLSRAFDVEVGGGYSNPVLAASISGDQESDSVVLSDQRLSQFAVEGSLIWRVSAIDLGTRAAPYVIAGAGYLRQIDADRTHADTGTVGHIGGGLRYWLRGNESASRAFGLRGEARLQLRSGGLDFEDKIRLSPAVYLLAMFGF